MAADSAWSLRGVDPRARDIARAAAKREGITIGEWLNRQLLEDGEGQASAGGEHAGSSSYSDSEALNEVLDRLSRRIEAAEHRSTLAVTNMDGSVQSLISRLDGAEEHQAEFTERYGAALEDLRATQRTLHARIEKMERQGSDPAGLAQLKALEDALRKLASRVEDSAVEARARVEALKSEVERNAKRSSERIDAVSREIDERIAQVERRVETDVASAAEAAARKVGADLDSAAKRLDREVRLARDEASRTRRDVEALINDRAAAGRSQIEAIETAVSNVNIKLQNAERDTDRAIKTLERSFAELDARVRRADAQITGVQTAVAAERDSFSAALERRFEGFSRELAEMVSGTRAEIAARMVEVARQEGAQAVIGHLQALDRRIGETESRQRKTLTRISEDVAKLAGAVEARVRRAEAEAQARLAEVKTALAAAEETPAAQAAEIARLQTRIKSAETRTSAATDSMSRRLDALEERMPERPADPEDLNRRVRESEDRTRNMISGALADVSRRLDHSDDQIASALSPVQRALDALRVRLEALESGRPVEVKAAAAGPATREERTRQASDTNADELDFTDPMSFDDVIDVDIEAEDLGDFGLDFETEMSPAPEPAEKKARARAAEPPEAEDKPAGGKPAKPDRAAPPAPEPEELAFSPELDAELRALETDDEFTLDVEEAADLDLAEPVEREPQAEAAPSKPAAPRDAEPDEELAIDALAIEDLKDDGDAAATDEAGSFDLVLGRAVIDVERKEPADARSLDPGDELEDGFDPFANDAPATAPPEDFLKAARKAAKKAAVKPEEPHVAPGFGPAATETAPAKKGRGLLIAAGGLAFLAVGAAGVIVLRDSARVDSANDGAGADPLEGLFSAPAPTTPPTAPLAAPRAAVDAVAPRYVAAEGEGAAERSINVDLAARSGQDFSLYVDGGDLYAAVRPETPAAGPTLDRMLSPAAPPTPSAAAAPQPGAPAPAEPAGSFGGGIEPAGIEDLAASAPEAESETIVGGSAASIEEAAGQGDPAAQYELGEILLERGETAEAVSMIQAAADQGVPAAEYRLGKLYEAGRGVGEDLRQARTLLERAAEAGHRNAMHSLGILYAEGRGAPQDFEMAARWFEEAALLGATDAQFNLAVLYEQGLGVPASLPDAYAWFAIAAKSGDEDAGARAQQVAGRLAPQALERADEAVRRFSPRPLDNEANGIYADAPWAQGEAFLQARIARVQAALAQLGYDMGAADGVMGPGTVAAIRAYQTDHALPATGEADAALLEKLEADLGAL
jgi:localization factor PodJL